MIDAVTWRDVFGSLRAVTSFAAVLLAPGYCLAWVTDLLGFRRRALGERLAWAIALSFGVTPLISVEVAKYGSLSLVCWLAAFCLAGCLWLMGREWWTRTRAPLGRWGRITVAVAAVWIVFVIAELVDVGIGNRLYFSVTVYDLALRTAFTDSVLRTGVPPANPLFWPGHAAPMRYYYFWYVLTAAAARLAAATARQAMIASAVWSGFGLAAILALFCRHFLPAAQPSTASPARRWPRTAVAFALLAVTGIDIVPVVVKAIFRLPTDADMDWWSAEQVTSWMASFLWVPHHMAGLICCLFGFLLVWLARDRSPAQRCLSGVIAGISFASAFGLSTWVALAFAMVMVIWTLWVLAWEPESRARVPVLLGAGLVAVIAVLPYVLELRVASSGPSSGSHLLRFGIRHIIESDFLTLFPWFAHLARSHPRLEDTIASLLLLFPGYFVELGFYVLILIAASRAALRFRGYPALGEAERTSLLLVCAGLCIATFLRSTVIDSNDFGFRSILIAQFFLLLLAVRWFESALGPPRPRLRSVMLWLGLAGTLYQAIDLRFFLPVEQALHRPDEIGLAERAMALRRGFDAMDARIPTNAVIEYNTTQPGDYFRFAEVMQANRQVATAYPKCNTDFGGNPSECRAVEQGVARLFASNPAGLRPAQSVALTAAQAQAECARLGISDLVATRWDGVWADRRDWVWTLPEVVDTGDVRVVDCREH